MQSLMLLFLLGFANDRRVNEDNIDINRNMMKDVEFAQALSRDRNVAFYEDFDFLLNPKSFPTQFVLLNDILNLFNVGYYLVKMGMSSLKRAIGMIILVCGVFAENNFIFNFKYQEIITKG